MYKTLISTFLISICLTSILQAKGDIKIKRILPEEETFRHSSKKITSNPTYIQMERSKSKRISSAAPLSDDANVPLNQQVFFAMLTTRSTYKVYFANYKGRRLKNYLTGDGIKVKGKLIHDGEPVCSLRKLDNKFVRLNPEYRKIKISKRPNKERSKGDSQSVHSHQDPNNYQLIRRIKRVPIQDGNDHLAPRYLEIIRYGDTYITSLSKPDYYWRYYSDENGKKSRNVKRATIYRTKHPLISLEALDKRYCQLHPEMNRVKTSRKKKER